MALHRLYHRQTHGNRVFGLLLVLALLSAAQHIAMHDIHGADGGLVGHQECQLNHLPFAQIAVASPGLPQQVPMLLAQAPLIQTHTQAFVASWLARAPPLSLI